MREPVGDGTFILKSPFSIDEKREMFRTWQFKWFDAPAGFEAWPVDRCVAHIDSIDGWRPMDLRK